MCARPPSAISTSGEGRIDMRRVTNVLLGASALALLGGGAAWADVVIATAGPMTGQYAVFGEQMKRGAELAVKDINANGGINGEQLVLEVGDDACDPKQAVAVANQFVNKGVMFVAGHFCSGSSIPASQVYNEEGILQISPASTNPTLTEQGFDNVFRTCGRDDIQGSTPANYVVDNKARARRSRSCTTRRPTARAWPTSSRSSSTPSGVEEVMYEAITAGDKDFTRADHQAQGCRRRPDLPRRLPHRGRPDRAPGARAGLRRQADVRRRPGRQAVLGDHRPDRRGHPDDLRARPAQVAGGRRGRRRVQGRAATIPKATRSTPMPRSRPSRMPPRRLARPTPRPWPPRCAKAATRRCWGRSPSTRRATSKEPKYVMYVWKDGQVRRALSAGAGFER